MHLQIDIKPVIVGGHIKPHYIMVTYFNDTQYKSTVSQGEVDYMLQTGAVHQVRGQMRNDATGELEFFDYENDIDGAGVMYTSKVYECEEKYPDLKVA